MESILGTVLVFAGVGGLCTALADAHLPGKGVDVPYVKVKGEPIRLQAGAVGTVVAAVGAAITKNPALIGLATGGVIVEGVQYTHHYAPMLFPPAPAAPAQMSDGVAVNGLPPSTPAGAPSSAPASYTDADAARFFDALDKLDRQPAAAA